MVTIIKNDAGKHRVSSVTGLPKGTICPTQVNETFSFWLDEWNPGQFEKLSDGLQNLIRRSDEFEAIHNTKPAVPDAQKKGAFDDMADDLPF